MTNESYRENISISVLITWPSPDADVAATIDALNRQTLPADQFEAIFILPDGDESEPIRNSVTELSVTELVAQASVRPAPGDSQASARRRALETASGDHIIYLDAGDSISPPTLSALLQAADGINVPTLLDDGDIEALAPSEATKIRDGESADVPVYKYVRFATRIIAKLYPADMVEPDHWSERAPDPAGLFNANVHTPYIHRYSNCRILPPATGAAYVRGSSTRVDHNEPAESQDWAIQLSLLGLDKGSAIGELPPIVDLLINHYESEIRSTPSHGPRRQSFGQSARARTIRRNVEDRGGYTGYDAIFTGRATANRSILLLAGPSTALNPLKAEVSFLRDAGIRVATVRYRGELVSAFRKIHNQRITPLPKPGASFNSPRMRTKCLTKRGIRYLAKAAYELSSHLLPTALGLKVAQLSGQIHAVTSRDGAEAIALDSHGRLIARANKLKVGDVAELHAAVVASAVHVSKFNDRRVQTLLSSTAKLFEQSSQGDSVLPSSVWTIVIWRLIRNVRIDAAREVISSVRRATKGTTDQELLLELDILAMIAESIDSARLPEAAIALGRRAMALVDAILEKGDQYHAVFLTALVLELLFNPEVHTNVPRSPLVEDPDGLLSVFSDSKMWRLLTSPTPGATDSWVRPSRTPRVIVFPGAYSRFSKVIVQAIEGQAEVEVLDPELLGSAFKTTGPDHNMLWTRFSATHGDGVAPRELIDRVRGADVVFADWADKGAVLASLIASAEARFVLRFHGVDALGVWQFLIDWSKVTDAIFVSDHIRATVEASLGERFAHVRTHVVKNAIDFERFRLPAKTGANRTLAMVGWAQKVKDPIWALEVLAELRKSDPTWKLKLIGADFNPNQHRLSERRYAEAYRERALRDDVVGSITYVGYTNNLPRHLADVGFALSTSLREGCPVGAIEIVASTAVPVVRDWPLFARVDGATRLFGAQSVVSTPQAAASRILSLSSPEDWERGAADARRHFLGEFGLDDLSERYAEIILGPRRSSAPNKLK